jgi:hypothetical protein
VERWRRLPSQSSSEFITIIREVEPMKQWVILFLLAVFAGGANAQSLRQAEWLGVWHGELDGQPSVVLTLADDTGALGGTVVLNIIEKQDGAARVIATEPHTLMNPLVEGDVLAFQFKKPDGDLLSFTVKRTADDKATIHCQNCGADAPTVSLARAK